MKIEEHKRLKESRRLERRRRYKTCAAILDSQWFWMTINVLTVYALFGEYLCVIATRRSGDIYFGVFTFLTIIVFTVELVFNTLVRTKYFCSFSFWIDIFCIASLLLDIIFFNGSLFLPQNNGLTDITD